jgi:hypothetical protein
MRKIMRALRVAGVVLTSAAMTLSGSIALASPTSQFSQVINAGTLSTDIRDASRVSVGSPSVSMTTKTSGFDCYSGGTASTGTLGTNTERLYVDNPDAADNGWTLTVAASSTTALWSNTGATATFDFNDAGGSGCTDGGDADTKGGQMTVDASVGTLTADCLVCTTTNVTKGSSAAFLQGTTDSVTLLTAAGSSDDVWRGYLTGASISQTIPAEQAADTYTINLTLTVTAS